MDRAYQNSAWSTLRFHPHCHIKCDTCFSLGMLLQVLSVAKDQNGCRFLQRKFDEGGSNAIGSVFPEILDNLIELMVDPFGNYLIQKLLDRCSEEQRLQVSNCRVVFLCCVNHWCCICLCCLGLNSHSLTQPAVFMHMCPEVPFVALAQQHSL